MTALPIPAIYTTGPLEPDAAASRLAALTVTVDATLAQIPRYAALLADRARTVGGVYRDRYGDDAYAAAYDDAHYARDRYRTAVTLAGKAWWLARADRLVTVALLLHNGYVRTAVR